MASLIKEIAELREKTALGDHQLLHLLLAQKTRGLKQIQGFTLELTPLCTLNCKMCYVHKTKEQYDLSVRKVSTARFIEIARESVACGAINATITGGEAMMHPDFVEIYRALYDMGVLITVMSNATVVTDEILELFAECPPSFVCITLYGFSEEIYLRTVGVACFERVIRNILRLKKLGIQVSLQSTVTKDMEADVPAIAQFAKENDMPFNFNTVLKAAREFSQDEISELSVEETISDYTDHETEADMPKTMKYGLECGAGSNHFHVTWDGYMQPCATFEMIRIDVINNRIDQAWNQLTDKVGKIPQLMKCQDCEYKNRCERCAVSHYGDTGEFGKVSPRLCYKIQHGIK